MSYKQVIAIGDSFTRGDELADCLVEHGPKIYSKNTWPALIAKSLNANYKCSAVGGKGNHWISWQVAVHIHNYKSVDSLFIINWSWLERFDYVDINNNDWLTTHPRHEDKLNHYFYRNLDSDLWNVHRNRQQIHSTVALLKEHNIDFIMTCIDPMCWFKTLDSQHESTSWWESALSTIRNQTIPNIKDFDGMTFLEWSKHNKFSFGPNGHPLEDAHSAAAQYIQRTVPLLH